MAILTATTPLAKHSGVSGVIWKFESDKQQENGDTEAVNSLSNVSGFVRFNLSTTHTWSINDIVTGSGFTSDNANVRAKITATTATTITTNIPYSGISSSSGTLTLTNDNFQLELTLKENGGAIQTVMYSVADTSDLFTFDLSGALRSILSPDLPLYNQTNIKTWATPESAFNYEIDLKEVWDDVESGTIFGASLNVNTISGDDIIAYNIAIQKNNSFADYVLQTTTPTLREYRTLNKRQFVNLDTNELFLYFISDESNVKAQIKYYDGAGGSVSNILGGVSLTLNQGYFPVNDNTVDFGTFGGVYAGITILRSSDNTVLSEEIEIIPITKPNCIEGRLEWINKLGGLDSYTFFDRNQSSSPDKQVYFDEDDINSLTFEDKEEIELISGLETTRVRTWIKDLYSSDFVYLIINREREKVVSLPGTYNTQSREDQRISVKLRPDNEILL